VAANYYQLFETAATEYASQVAIEVQRPTCVDSVSYAALQEEAECVAALLAASGVSRGDRCVLYAENSARWCAAFLGILRLGAVAVPLDTTYKAKQIAALLRDSGAGVVFTVPGHLSSTKQALGEVGSSCPIILLHGSEAGCGSLDQATGVSEQGTLPACLATAADPAVILYTSGTTSDPKGVVLAHGNLLGEIEAIRGVIRLDQQDCILGVLPLFHALAQVANLLLPLASGSRVVFLESVNTSEILRALRERGISAFCCVPQFFYLLHKRIEQELDARGALQRKAFQVFLWTNGKLRLGSISAAICSAGFMGFLVGGCGSWLPVGRGLIRRRGTTFTGWGLTFSKRTG
jgi:long-chain acyl-CoA synthetase